MFGRPVGEVIRRTAWWGIYVEVVDQKPAKAILRIATVTMGFHNRINFITYLDIRQTQLGSLSVSSPGFFPSIVSTSNSLCIC